MAPSSHESRLRLEWMEGHLNAVWKGKMTHRVTSSMRCGGLKIIHFLETLFIDRVYKIYSDLVPLFYAKPQRSRKQTIHFCASNYLSSANGRLFRLSSPLPFRPRNGYYVTHFRTKPPKLRSSRWEHNIAGGGKKRCHFQN